MTESRTIVDQSRFFLTGSDFSELAALEGQNNELNSTSGFRQLAAESTLQKAKFKRLDMAKLENSLEKAPKLGLRRGTQANPSPR